MSTNYRCCYETMELQPGATWRDVRRSFKHLVQCWHPDKYEQDAEAKQVAEERLREINKAYLAFSEYYSQHGKMPLTAGSSTADWQFQKTSGMDFVNTHEVNKQARSRPRNIVGTKWLLVSLIFGILVFGVIWLRQTPGPVMELSKNKENSLIVKKAPRREVKVERGLPRDEKEPIRIGSSAEEVLEIEGEPLMKMERRWDYGPSFIEFRRGKVINWHSSVLRPLNVDEQSGGLQN